MLSIKSSDIIFVLVAVVLFITLGWYIDSLKTDVKNLTADRDIYKDQAAASFERSSKYESAKQLNEKKTNQLLLTLEGMNDETPCAVPAGLRHIIDSL